MLKDYGRGPRSHFQRQMRKNSAKLVDHISKSSAPIHVKRMELIPKEPGADWRNLPNEVVQVCLEALTSFFFQEKLCTCRKSALEEICSVALFSFSTSLRSPTFYHLSVQKVLQEVSMKYLTKVFFFLHTLALGRDLHRAPEVRRQKKKVRLSVSGRR